MSVFSLLTWLVSLMCSVHTNKKDPHTALIIFLFYLPTVSFDWQNRFREKIFVILFIIYSAFLFNISCWSCHSQIQIYPQPQSGNEIHQLLSVGYETLTFDELIIFSLGAWSIFIAFHEIYFGTKRGVSFISLKWKQN